MTRMGPDQIISELRSWMVESNNENNEGYLRKHYNDLLKSGGSKHYSEVLKPFNIDLKDKKSWQKGLSMITKLIDDFENSL